MKKILPVIIAVALSLTSCSKSSDFSGSGSDVTYSIGPYMMCIADNLIVDNIKVLENRINDNAAGVQSKASSFTTPEDPSYRVPGVRISKAIADSTWIISNKDLDYWFLGSSYPTDYKITARMLPGDYNHYHSWEVSIEGERREKDGYSCRFATDDAPLTYTIGLSEYSWSSCTGNLNMIVYKNGKAIDSIVMVLRGDHDDYSLVRTY